MRSALADFPHALHSVVFSICFSSIISERFSGSTLICTDGSRSEGGAVFRVSRVLDVACKEPSGVFTAEITALLTALRFVGSAG
jgi:hypothetical protein